MSGMKFEVGAKFKKAEGAGFVGESLVCLIPDIEDNQMTEPCFMCDDPECREYPTLFILGDNDEVLGSCYHVSECQMEPIDGPRT